MLNTITSVAKNDDRIRAVVMNGSRVNPGVKTDRYQDYDIVYYVEDYHAFPKDRNWIKVFGELLIMQTKDDQCDASSDDAWYIYLMQFKDGNRIDLSIRDIKDFALDIREDSLTRVLINKDNYPIDIPSPNESSYYVQKPSEKMIRCTINEGYWVSLYVAKGVARNQVLYAMDHLAIIRKQLRLMLTWWVGFNTNFKATTGKSENRLEKFIKPAWYERLLKTYPTSDKEAIYTSLYTTLDLFHEVTTAVASFANIDYDDALIKGMKSTIKKRYQLIES
jgi:aminoglycoside 6-adenylyltransferase